MRNYRIYILWGGKISQTVTSTAPGHCAEDALEWVQRQPFWGAVEGDEVLVISAHGDGDRAREEQALFRVGPPPSQPLHTFLPVGLRSR